MKRDYPYLELAYLEDANSLSEKRNFLSLVDSQPTQKQYVRITLLNWAEEPIKEIQGELVSGTISKDGSSALRRTCQLAASISGGDYTVEDTQLDFSINKKVFIETGVKNYTDQYREYPILWFPQGVFFIAGAAITSNTTSAVNINLTLKDKMAKLNGDIGGKFTATTVLDELTTRTAAGAYVTDKVLIYDLIFEMVHHFGGEDINNIVIEDVPLRIKRVLKWTGSTPLWLVPAPGTSAQAGNLWYEALIEEPATKPSGTIQVTSGTDAGYVYDDFVYTSELVAAPGDTVVSVLDKIKTYLGNFEYFYDDFGVFHFREIKNYLNTTQATTLLDDMSKKDYIVERSFEKSVYSFSDDNNLISVSVNPKYDNIKNDFSIQGLRKITNTNIAYPIIYHLAIDKKPQTSTYYDLLVYTEESTNLVKCAFPKHFNSEQDLPLPGDATVIYRVGNSFFYWANEIYKPLETIKYYPAYENENSAGYQVQDWRTEIYLQGLLSQNNGTDAGLYYANLQTDYKKAATDSTWLGNLLRQTQLNKLNTAYYFAELDAFWPIIYNLETQKFFGEEEDKTLLTSSLADGNYFLDFIEPHESELGQFAVESIGRRSHVEYNEDINCLFAPEIPNIVFINVDDPDTYESTLNECKQEGQPYTQVRSDTYWGFATGGYKNPAYETLKLTLQQKTVYQKTLSLTTLPVLHLAPLSRITINDKTTNTYGDYIVQTISLPLKPGSTMNITCSEVFERQ